MELRWRGLLLSNLPSICIGAAGILLSGCARFSTTQTDRSYLDENGNQVREITTSVKASTFFDSHSQLAQFKAIQTDKTQNASVGTLTQDSVATNIVRIIEVSVEAAVKSALRSSMIP